MNWYFTLYVFDYWIKCLLVIFRVAQTVKNLPAMREALVQSLGWEDSMEKGKATHFSILA